MASGYTGSQHRKVKVTENKTHRRHETLGSGRSSAEKRQNELTLAYISTDLIQLEHEGPKQHILFPKAKV